MRLLPVHGPVVGRPAGDQSLCTTVSQSAVLLGATAGRLVAQELSRS
ncbi:hypothetical protein ABZS88_41565 [Streptomyces sp. NPDC005480]